MYSPAHFIMNQFRSAFGMLSISKNYAFLMSSEVVLFLLLLHIPKLSPVVL